MRPARLPFVLALAAILAVPRPAAAADGGDDAGKAADDAFAALDANGDGRLSSAEIDAALITALDGDGDGLLSKEEYRKGLQAMAEKAAAGRAAAPPKDGPAPGETFADWAKRKVATDPRFHAESRRTQFLRNFDRDPADGRIQRKEYVAADADRVFRDFDRDRDGALDDRELLLLMKDQLADLQKARKHPTRANFLVLYDIDDDRRVTRQEYAFLGGPASAFNSYDDDGDGVVTYDELIYDRPSKDRRNRGKDAAPEAAPPPEKKDVWSLYDKDGDGRVTAEEFGGGEAVFRRLDRNRDGALTPAVL